MKISKKEKDSLYSANTNETIKQHPDISCLEDIKLDSFDTREKSSESTRKFCYSQEYDTYQIEFINYDGTLLQISECRLGEMPQYHGKTPQKKADVMGKYKFVGWRPKLQEVKKNQVYEAVYEEILHVQYKISGNCATIIGCEKNTTNLMIPSIIKSHWKEYPVTSIAESAFRKCRSLTSIVIPSSVISIGQDAFQGCSSLTSIIIPSGVTSIGNCAFDSCSSLTSVKFEEGSKITSIGWGTFEGCSSLTTIAIPSSVTSIGEYAFFHCDSLSSIVIPSSVTSIGEYAFSDCVSLISVTFEKESKLTNIGEGAFENCRSLTSIMISNRVTSIGEMAFSWCDSLTIYCEVSSKPDGWNLDWNYSNRPVYWEIN